MSDIERIAAKISNGINPVIEAPVTDGCFVPIALAPVRPRSVAYGMLPPTLSLQMQDLFARLACSVAAVPRTE